MPGNSSDSKELTLTLTDLPQDVFSVIIKYLSVEEVLKLEFVCKDIANAISATTPFYKDQFSKFVTSDIIRFLCYHRPNTFIPSPPSEIMLRTIFLKKLAKLREAVSCYINEIPPDKLLPVLKKIVECFWDKCYENIPPACKARFAPFNEFKNRPPEARNNRCYALINHSHENLKSKDKLAEIVIRVLDSFYNEFRFRKWQSTPPRFTYNWLCAGGFSGIGVGTFCWIPAALIEVCSSAGVYGGGVYRSFGYATGGIWALTGICFAMGICVSVSCGTIIYKLKNYRDYYRDIEQAKKEAKNNIKQDLKWLIDMCLIHRIALNLPENGNSVNQQNGERNDRGNGARRNRPNRRHYTRITSEKEVESEGESDSDIENPIG